MSNLSDPSIHDITMSREPIELPSSISNEILISSLQDCAAHFRESAIQPDAIREFLLGERVGRLIIQAWRQDLLSAVPRIGELIKWHTTTPDPNESNGRQATRIRCPYNLFSDLVGATFLPVQNLDGKVEPTGDPLWGGLLPRIAPELFPDIPMSLNTPAIRADRNALACEFVAKVIRQTIKTSQNQLVSNRILASSAVEHIQLNDMERNIIQALGSKRMVGQALAESAGYTFNSVFKQTLASLVRQGILSNKNDSQGRGYELVKPLSGQKSGQTDG